MKKALCFSLLVAGLLFAGCGPREPTAPQPTNPPAAGGNPLAAPTEYLGAVAKSKSSAQKTLDTANLRQAIQAFSAGEGRFPKDLNELVGAKYLPKLPAPPPGMKFDYNPATGQIRMVPQ